MKISVITTTYNSIDRLKHCIKSVSKSNISNLEHIIIDDGSTDNTVKYMNSLENENISFFSVGRLGRAKALNVGIEYSNGDYVCILDADDLMLSENFDFLVSYLEKNVSLLEKYSIIFGHVLTLNSKIGCDYSSHKVEALVGKQIKSDLLYFLNVIPHVCVLIKKSDVYHVGQYSESRTSQLDWDLWLRLIDYEKKAIYFDVDVAIKTIHNEQFFENKNHVKYVMSGANLAILAAYKKKGFLFSIIVVIFSVFRLFWSFFPRKIRVVFWKNK